MSGQMPSSSARGSGLPYAQVLLAPMHFGSELDTAAPELMDALKATVEEAVTTCRIWVATLAAPQASGVVVNQAVNDYVDLVFELSTGRGRPAIRAARAVFEHLVNLRELQSVPGLGARYLANHDVADQLEASIELGVDRLVGNERRSERHRLHKMGRDSTPGYESALDAYGPGFRRQWQDRSLRDRALDPIPLS